VIVVCGLSPAIDVTYPVSKLTLGNSNRLGAAVARPGGKAVNVASVLHVLGAKVKLLLPLGGDSGEWIKNQLEQTGIDLKLTPIAAKTRSSFTLVESASDSEVVATVLNEPASEITESELVQLENLLLGEVATAVIISGSIPSSISPARFGGLIQKLKAAGAFVIVDTSGEYLIEAAKASADLLKPNSEELAQLFPGIDENTAARNLLDLGAAASYLSKGSGGGTYLSASEQLELSVPRLSGNPTGAGDAFVAGFAKAHSEHLTLEQALIFGSACGGAAVLAQTAGVLEPSDLATIKSKVKVVSK
jgi:tagatose 6-phosphate kinase